MTIDKNAGLGDPQIEKLLQDYSKSRDDLVKDLEVITTLKGKLELLLPTDINFRNKHLIDDKLKIFSAFFSSILSCRQEINKTIVQEIELRRKLNSGKGDDDISDQFIRDIAEKIEESNPKNAPIEFPSDISDKPTALPEDRLEESNLMKGN